MRSVRSAAFLSFAIALASGVGSGCWKYAKDYCTSGASCASGICDMRTMGCVPVDAGADLRDGATGAAGHIGDAASDGVIDMPTDVQAMSGCSTMNECHDPLLPACDVPTRSCVGCLQSTDCTTAGKPACDVTAKTCVGCVQSTDCTTAGKLVCEAASKTCVGCVQNTDCTTAGAQVCEPASKTCVGCLQNTDCKVAGKGVCDMTARACVGCLMNSDCGGATPICDAKACRACAKDAECTAGPSVCMPDGHCASTAETLYVQNIASCNDTPAAADTMAGSTSEPFCSMQPVLGALSATRDLVVVTGTVAGASWTFAGQGAPQTVIVGKQAAAIGSVTTPAFSMQSGTVYIRGVSFSPSASIGISAKGGTLRLDTVKVDSCKGGGIFLDSAAFDIRNTVVTNNGPGQQGPTSWGGILVNSLPASGAKQIALSTVENNKAPGLVCAGPITASGVIADGNSAIDVSTTCGITLCLAPSATCGAQ